MTVPSPTWITPKGFLFTATELIINSYTVTATNASSYTLLNGNLPLGMSISSNTGVISGTPPAVLNLTKYNFTVRAQNTSASIDRSFGIDVQGSDVPIWNTVTITTEDNETLTTSTTQGYLPLGLEQQPYALNKQYIDYQFSAGLVEAPVESKIQYYIPNQNGTLPPNLKLSTDGKLTGIINCFTSTDVNTTTNTTITTYIPKEYQFYIAATDSVRNQSRLFKLTTIDPNMLRYWTTTSITPITVLNISLNTQPYSYLQPPQFIQSSDLGIIRADNNHILSVNAYDPAPLLGTLTYALITGTSIYNNLPYGLELDSVTGYINGYIPYQPAYTRSYNFTVEATKTDGIISTSTRKSFNLKVKGTVENTIEWVSTSSLGSILEGQTSELYIQATQIESNFSIKYNKISGDLPQGLTLQADGTITGSVNYNTSGTYVFTATAKDVYELSEIEKTFTLTVKPVVPEYTEIYIKSFLSKAKRDEYSNFVNNEEIFNPNLIYRYYDNNFGIQKEPKIVLEFGIEKINLEDFYPTLTTNFYRRRFYFGEIKLIKAVDNTNNVIYELIYADAIDQLSPNSESNLSIVINSQTYYPASIDNMKYRLKNITLDDSSKISINNQYNPKFFNNLNVAQENTVSYIKYIPISYAAPGQGNKILNRIKFSKFDFKKFYIETDRLIVKDNLTEPGEKYLFFPKKTIKN